MPKISTYTATEDVGSRSGGQYIPPDLFDSGAAGLQTAARGLAAAGDTMGAIAARQREENKRIQAEQDAVWVGESVESERRHWLDWLAAPSNAQNANVAGDFLKYSQSRVNDLVAQAPSQAAASRLKLALGSSITSTYGQTMEMGRKASLNRLGQSFDKRTAEMMIAYRSGGSEAQLTESFTALNADIDQFIGTLSPELGNQLKTKYTLDLVYAAMDTNPAFAEKLVNASTLLDERQRSQLLDSINGANKRVAADVRATFERTRADAQTLWELGKNFNEIPLAQYEAVYPKDVAAAHKANDDEIRLAMNGAFQEYANIQEKPPTSQFDHLTNLSKAVGGARDALKLKKLGEMVTDSARLFERDRAAWLLKNNREISALTDQARAVPDAERPAILAKRADALLRYQGRAPEGLDPEEAAKYLDVPEHTRSILTEGEATEYAQRINAGSPSQVLTVFDQLMAQFTDPKHRVIAFNDMVRLPTHGVRQELQLVIQNRGAWWLDSYVGAITQASGVKALTGPDAKAIDDKIEGSPQWLVVQRALLGDNFQRAGELAGFKRGVAAYASAAVLSGMSVGDAVKQSMDRLFNESLGFADVNGKSLAIPRQSPKGPRTDDQIEDLGRRLSVALRFVNPAKVDDARLGVDSMIKGSIERFQAVRDQITSSGFFQPTQDGQGVTLFVPDGIGGAIQVVDRKGQPFRIMYDDLPEFINDVTISTTEGLRHQKVPMMPDTTYDLLNTSGSTFGGTLEYRSNWPAQPPWLRN